MAISEKRTPIPRQPSANEKLSEAKEWHEDSIEKYEQDLDAAHDGVAKVCAYTTGLDSLDEIVRGLHQGQVYIFAGPTSSGKTSLALTTAMTLALTQMPPVLFISLEMSHEDLAARGISWLTEIPQADVIDARAGRAKLTDEQRQAISLAKSWIPRRVQVIATASITVKEVSAAAGDLKKDKGLSLVICDYIGLVSPESGKRYDTSEREVRDVSRAFKALAMQMNVPVILLSQINRNAAKNRKPTVNDLRDSGAIENDASAVVIIGKSDRFPDSAVRLHVKKNRFGKKDVYRDVGFNRQIGKFVDDPQLGAQWLSDEE